MRVGEPGRGVLDDSARPGRRVDGGKSRGGSEADWLEGSQPPRLRARLHPPTREGGAGILTRAARGCVRRRGARARPQRILEAGASVPSSAHSVHVSRATALSLGLSPADPETTSARTMTTCTLHVPPARHTRGGLPPLTLTRPMLTVARDAWQVEPTVRAGRHLREARCRQDDD